MAESPTLNPEGESPALHNENETASPVNTSTDSTPSEIDAILLEARQRRARVRAKTEEIINRNSQLVRNETMDTKEVVAWGIALALVAGLLYTFIITFI